MNHYDHLRWAQEFVADQILEQVIKEGHEPGKNTEESNGPEGRKGDKPEEVRRARTTGGTVHHTSQVVKVTLPERKDEDGKTFHNKVRRLERARHQRDQLIRRMEEVWSFLEDGLPGLETELEPEFMEAGRPDSRKRKRSISREDEAKMLEDELEDVRVSMMKLRVELEGYEDLKEKTA